MTKPRLRHFHWFLLASAALISVVVYVSGQAVCWFFERQMFANEEEHAVNIVQTQVRQHLTPADFDLSRSPGRPKLFESLPRELPEVCRIRVYDRTGRVVWSDDPRPIGAAAPSPYLAKALTGERATDPPKPRKSQEGNGEYVVGTYVPITFPDAPGVVGVIATYREIAPLLLGIRRTQRLVWGTAGAIGLVLYVSLGFVVWTASGNERRAISRLETSQAALLAKTEELEQASQALRETQVQLLEKERLAAAGQVVVGLSHAVLNPLTGILGALQVLKQEKIAGAERLEALTQAEAEIHKIEEVVRQLSALRRVIGTQYVGKTTMLDLERSSAGEEGA